MKPQNPKTFSTAVFTIVSKNYLHFARTLMGSLRTVHPEWKRFVLLVDELRGDFDTAQEKFEVIEVSKLPLPEMKKFLFRYTILELNTAVKPWMIEWLFKIKGYDRVIYIDPDIYIYKPMREVEQALNNGSLMVLTPHLTGQLDDDKKPSERQIVQSGAYNLGFIALAKHTNLMPFIHWWQSKLENDCVVDIPNGLFVDQKWIDLAPGMFGDVFILRHEGYNVAYWNLKHRKIERRGNEYFVNNQPLVFFHFSGLNPKSPDAFSKHQDRFNLSDLGPAKDIVQSYCNAALNNGLEKCMTWHYAYGVFADGNLIHALMRKQYRTDEKIKALAGEDPFTLDSNYFNAAWDVNAKGEPLITILMRLVWEARPDVQAYFPDIQGRHRFNFAYWFVHTGAREHNVPVYCVEPVKHTLSADSDTTASPVKRGIMKTAFWLNPIVKHIPASIKDRVKAKVFTDTPQIETSPIPFADELRFGVNYAGFYDQEGFAHNPSSVWLGQAASIRLTTIEEGVIKIIGEYSSDFHTRAHGKPDIMVDVMIDGDLIGQFQLKESGPFERIVPVPKIENQSSPILTLKSEHCFVPSKLGMNNDDRQLSFKVSKIFLNDSVILDFSNTETPFMPGKDRVLEMGINIIGYVKSEHGVGQSARSCALALEAGEIPFVMFDFNVGNTSRTADDSWNHKINKELPHGINLFHVNADQMPVVRSHLGPNVLGSHYNIAYWHWELPELPDRWLSGFIGLNEVWVPTQFVMDAVSAKSPFPVVKIPHAIRFSVSANANRRGFGLPENDFLFLMMYDMHSYQERKNPEAVIDAFCQAFPIPDGVSLVIKIHNTAAHPVETEELKQRLIGKKGILLIDKMLTRQEVYDLEYLCDSFVSLHRSEGFGLGLAESMFLGKPVIGTYWSGNVDFMNYKNSCPVDYELIKLDRDYGPYKKGQVWADPDIEHAAWYMRTLVDDPEWARQIAAEGQRTMLIQFSPEMVGELYRKRLHIISRL